MPSRYTPIANPQLVEPQRGYGQSFEGLPGLAIGGGVNDALTDIMVTGGRDDIPLSQGAAPMAPSTPQLVGGPPMGGPPMGGPPMGGPPMGGPPMGGPPMGGPPMGGPAAAETLMANADMLQGDMQRPPMEGAGGGGIEQDAMLLADAVLGRTQGNVEASLAILDGATQILIGSGQQGAPVPPPGAPLMAAHGRPLMTEAGQSELDTRMHDIKDYEDWTPLDEKIQKVLSNEEVYKKYFSN